MENETYNGWTNRETWLIHLHISNDVGMSEEARAIAKQAAQDYRETMERDHPTLAADGLDTGCAMAAGESVREWLDDAMEQHTSALREQGRQGWDNPMSLLLVDVWNNTLGRADLREIGRALLEE